MAKLKIGDAPRRAEDIRFLTGAGCYVDDIRPPNLAYAVVVRSPHAHAALTSVDVGEASGAPGVLAVLSGRDLDSAGIGAIQPYEQVNVYSGEAFRFPTQYPLAKERVRYVGEPVALVVAESRAQALDAAERMSIGYDALPATTTVAEAIATGDQANVCLEWAVGDERAADTAIAAAAHVTRLDLHNHRIATNSMEPRGAIGEYDPARGRYTLHVSSQSLHMARDRVAQTLGVEPSKVRFVAPDVGGGFGVKNFMYPEMVLTLWAARVTGRPVKWINGRNEGFVSDHQARDNDARAELALDVDGNFTALRVWSRGNLGAYLTGSMARIFTEQFVKLPGGPYRIPALHVDVGAVYTNTVPTGVTRGPGFAEFANIMERLIDQAAAETGRDPAALRIQNMAHEAAMPFTNAVGAVIDSGHFAANVQAAMARAGPGFAARKAASARNGKCRGLGIGYHIKATFGAPDENVELRFDDDDRVTFTTGTQAIGQGHETSFPQIISDLLGVPAEDIRYRAGDTDLIPKGGGHGSSRATYMAGTAIYLAVERIKEKGRRFAAQMLEASEDDIEFRDGAFGIAGTDRSVGLMAVAKQARADGEPLDTLQDFSREHHTFPNGCHVAEVEVDPETGTVRLEGYTAVDDYGTMINPMLVAGQVHGAIAQGVGQAMMEHVVYEHGTGQLLAGSFMDYALPRADDLPSFDVTLAGIPCATNPLGVKGCGEAGAIAGFPAVVNAVVDALRPYGVTAFEGPLTPERVWWAIEASTMSRVP
jgi:aerobic carbon-monoxide dehydrogenase large subunit